MSFKELVPFEQFVATYAPVTRPYLYTCYYGDWRDTTYYLRDTLQLTFLPPSGAFAHWIHCSTGRLCTDPTVPHSNPGIVLDNVDCLSLLQRPNLTSLSAAAVERLAIESLTHPGVHWTTSVYVLLHVSIFVYVRLRIDRPSVYKGSERSEASLSRSISLSVSTASTVTPGGVFSRRSLSQYEEAVEVAYSPEGHVPSPPDWPGSYTARMKNGWSRCSANYVFNTTTVFEASYRSWRSGCWLSQANHIFKRLQITSNLEDYVLVFHVSFRLSISSVIGDPPPGYLFLCPREDFRTGPRFRWPELPTYWSLDPAGLERLSAEEAVHLGFPCLQLTTTVYGNSWDTSVYDGLHEFHRGKGFDPDSQDIALYRGDPLFRLSTDSDPPFAHVDELSEAEIAKGNDAQRSIHENCRSGDGLADESDAKEDEIYGEPRQENTPEAHRQSIVQTTPSGFVRVLRALQHGLANEIENMGADPISPYLV
ncbi:hypothetical protein B0H13DRAFT_2360532 [Mycena leptocephala]|nr:hypothetical protein B0H13DRAFT_2360532 [Mycena leptocephala]